VWDLTQGSLEPAEVPQLTAAEVAQLSPTEFAQLSPAEFAQLSPAEVIQPSLAAVAASFTMMHTNFKHKCQLMLRQLLLVILAIT